METNNSTSTKQGHRKIVKKMFKLAGKKSAKSYLSGKIANEQTEQNSNSVELIFQSQNEDVKTSDATSRIPSTCMYIDTRAPDTDTQTEADSMTIEKKDSSSGMKGQAREFSRRSGNPANSTQSTKILLDGKKGNLHIGQYYKDDENDDDNTDV